MFSTGPKYSYIKNKDNEIGLKLQKLDDAIIEFVAEIKNYPSEDTREIQAYITQVKNILVSLAQNDNVKFIRKLKVLYMA